jgi:phosphate uptake regulator
LGEQKKQNYLQAVRASNQDLVRRIKELDKQLNCEVDSLSRRIVRGRRKSGAPKLEQLETSQLSVRFQELERLKR